MQSKSCFKIRAQVAKGLITLVIVSYPDRSLSGKYSYPLFEHMGRQEPSYAILHSTKVLDSSWSVILGNECVFLYHSDEESDDKRDMHGTQSELPSPSGEHNSSSGGKSSKRGKRRVRALDDSDEDDTGLENGVENRGNKSVESEDDEGADKENTEATKKATTSDSDDDDDLEYSRNISDTRSDTEDVNNNADKSLSEAGKKRPRHDNDDESSDDDEEFNLPLNFHKKARRVLVDDDDDD